MKLDKMRTILVGLAFLSISAFWQLYDGIIPLMLKNTFHVNDALSGAIMALDNVLALFMLPLFGMLSDKTHSRLGRRTPYILFGTVTAVACMLLLPIADNARSLPLFVVGLFLVLISMSTYRSPAVALMPDVTPKPLRSKGNAVINLMGTVGGMLTLLLIGALVPKTDTPSYLLLFAVVAVIMAVAVGVLFATVREPKLVEKRKREYPDELESDIPETADHPKGKESLLPKDIKRSLLLLLSSVALWFMGYNAVTTAFSKYVQIQWKLAGGDFAYLMLIATGAAIVSYIPVGIAASKIGRKKSILIGVALLACCFGGAAFFPTYHILAIPLFALVGVAWAAINVNSYPMVVEMCRGSDIGKFTGYYYTFSMAAQIVTPILSGALLEYIGYWTLFPYAALCVAAAFVTMQFVRHGDSRPAPAPNKLDAYESLDS